jgi:hypothetical protein
MAEVSGIDAAAAEAKKEAPFAEEPAVPEDE